MRKITEIIIHCADTPERRDVRAADIRKWHVKDNGWNDIGYHYVIDLDGTIEAGRDLETIGAHCKGHNQNSIGICYIGGRDAYTYAPADTRTDAQKASLAVAQILAFALPAGTYIRTPRFFGQGVPVL